MFIFGVFIVSKVYQVIFSKDIYNFTIFLIIYNVYNIIATSINTVMYKYSTRSIMHIIFFCETTEFSNKLSMRLAIFSIYISSLIITSAYSASLISFLTLSKTKLPFSNLEGYVKDGSYKLIVMKNSAELDTVNVSLLG